MRQAEAVVGARNWTESVWNGEHGAYSPQRVPDILEGHSVTLDEFRHAVVMVCPGTRAEPWEPRVL